MLDLAPQINLSKLTTSGAPLCFVHSSTEYDHLCPCVRYHASIIQAISYYSHSEGPNTVMMCIVEECRYRPAQHNFEHKGGASHGSLLWHSLIPRLSGTWICIVGRAWYLFCVSMTNQNRTRTERQWFAHCSTNYVFNAQCVWYLTPNS